MARTPITKTTRVGDYPTTPLAANAADVNMQASTGASGSSGNQIPFDSASRICVIVQNIHATNPFTVTFTSLADPFNRTGDISAFTLQAGDISVFTFSRNGWCQSDGNLYLESNSVNIKFGAFNI